MVIPKTKPNKISTTNVSKETYYACCQDSVSLNSRLDMVLTPEIAVGVEGDSNNDHEGTTILVCGEEDSAILASTNYLNADLHLGGSKTIK